MKKYNISFCANWITIVTGPLTIISAILAVFGKRAPNNILAAFSIYEKSALYIIMTSIVFLFLLFGTLKGYQFFTRNRILSLPGLITYFIFNTFGLIVLVAVEVLFFSKIIGFPEALDVISIFALIGPAILWESITYLLAYSGYFNNKI